MTESGKGNRLGRRLAAALQTAGGFRLLLFGLILLYCWVFTGLAFNQHAGMRTHKADLGQIDQAVWNSSRGRFVEMTDYGYISTRMSDHVEPILALVSPVFWVWDDVRALLLLQAAVTALGAWPLYELALRQMAALLSPADRTKIWLWEPVRQAAQPVALALAAAYLLTPQLQSAALTEFHAIPLAVPLIMWALWAVAAGRWGQFAAAAALTALVKEEAALLAAGLGLWALWRLWLERRLATRRGEASAPVRRPALLALSVMLASLAWFYVTTFVIVPAHAAQTYGVAQSGYFARYGALGDSPVDIFKSFFTQPHVVWQIATEPARLEYLYRLAMPYGFLSLLAPDVVLLALPVLLANLLSAYPAQYYGEFHYSAPVSVYFAAGAAYGAARLWRWLARRADRTSGHFQHLPASGLATMNLMAALRNSRAALRPLAGALLALWIIGWAIGAYAAFGRGPGGARYDLAPVSAHHRLLGRFTEQLPADARVTATAAVHPHVSHRRFVYQFPLGLEPPADADWALLDVTTATDMAPGDVRTAVEAMLAGEWGVVDAADGFMLLAKGAADKTLPAEFYTFAVTQQDGAQTAEAAPLHLADVTTHDWPRWRRSEVEMRWRVGEGFDAATMAPQIELRTPSGETLYRFADAMPPALVWYPPEKWRAGDEVRVTTLPLYLPRAWGVVAEKTPGLVVPPELAIAEEEGGVLVAAYRRGAGDKLTPLPADLFGAAAWGDWFGATAAQESVLRMADGETVQVRASLPAQAVQPGALVDVHLSWTAASGWPEGATVFVHLRRDGANVAQNDGLPRYFVKYKTADALNARGAAIDWRQLAVPDVALTAGEWSVAAGLYDPASGVRAAVVGESGAVAGDELVLGVTVVDEPPVPDQACALIPATCESQPVR